MVTVVNILITFAMKMTFLTVTFYWLLVFGNSKLFFIDVLEQRETDR